MLNSFLNLLLSPVILVPLAIYIGVRVRRIKKYKSSTYYQITKEPYSSIRKNLGKRGEFLTYEKLRKYEEDGAKFLFNIYIPKENGETSEVDVLMITSKGIFVFESKNYSGWIFGNDKQRNWCQTLPTGKGKSRKEYFYNPVLQNRSHIKHLRALVGDKYPMHSIIVFSERCTLKSIELESDDVKVIKRDRVANVVADIYKNVTEDVLTKDEVLQLFDQLFQYTQISEAVKVKHIANIQSQLAEQNSDAPTITKEDLRIED